MSEINEELLNDETDLEYADLEDIDEEALLQDDDQTEDILQLDVGDEISVSAEDPKVNAPEIEDEEKTQRKDKFSTERKLITAPESTSDDYSETFKKPLQRYNTFRGGRGGRLPRRNNNFGNNNVNEKRNMLRRNKTVLINPRFQGIVHVNNANARLAWDNAPHPVNPWSSGNVPGPRQNYAQVNQQQMLSVAQPQIHMQMNQPPPVHMQMHINPPNVYPQMGPNCCDNNYNQQSPMHQNQQPVQVQYQQGPQNERQVFNHPQAVINPPYSNYQSPAPIIINTSFPPPQLSNQMYNNQYYPVNNNYQNQNTVSRQTIQTDVAVYGTYNQKRNVGQTFIPRKKQKPFQNNRFQENTQRRNDRPVPVKKTDRPTVIKQVVVEEFQQEEDEETKKLRLLIEEQKKKRELLLLWKEERRKQQKQEEESKSSINKVQKVLCITPEKSASDNFPQVRLQMKKKSPNIVVTNGYSRRLSKYQKGSISLKQNVTNANNTNNRVILVNNANVASTSEHEITEKQLDSFLSDHKVLPKDRSLIETRIVVVKNLSTSTNNKKILSICRNIGDVQKLQRIKNECQATITFKSVASAHAFYKKYQRYMVDLSMIEVSLKPETENND